MTEYGAPFDGILTGDATIAPYSATEWARLWQLRHGVGSVFPNYGVFAGTGGTSYSPLEVRATAVISANVDVQVGAALVDGRFYENTAVKTLTVNSNSSGNARIDTVILRLDFAAQTIRLAIKQGTPAASPARPTMQQDATFWEMPLADIAVANGFTTLAQSTITQRQRAVQGSSFGWQPYAYPIVFTHGVTYAGSISLTGNGQALIVPFVLSANMFLQGVTWRGAAGVGLNSSIGWDLYFEDTDDGLTAENTLRRVAQSNGAVSAGSGGVVVNTTLDSPTPVPLPPGTYWLILQNRHATDTYGLTGLAAASSFTVNIGRLKTFAVAGPGQTAEMVTSVSNVTTAPMIRLNGRVFGESAAF